MMFTFSGGATTYRGRDMYEAHRSLGLNEEHFSAIVDCFVATTQQLRVPGSIVNEAVAVLSMLKRQVCASRKETSQLVWVLGVAFLLPLLNQCARRGLYQFGHHTLPRLPPLALTHPPRAPCRCWAWRTRAARLWSSHPASWSGAEAATHWKAWSRSFTVRRPASPAPVLASWCACVLLWPACAN